MRKLLVLLLLVLLGGTVQAQLVREYVKSFALKSTDTIVINLQIPYEIIDWKKSFVRTYTQVESFSLPKDIMRRVQREGRYRMKGVRRNNRFRIYLSDIHHVIMVKGVQLTDEVIAQIYIPEGFPLQVVCSNKTPEQQLEDLWLQQEVMTRRLNYPIRKAINTDYYAEVNFQAGKITEANAVKGTKRYYQLKVAVGDKTYNLVSRLGKVYTKVEELIGKDIVFVAHNLYPELRKLPNEGMVLVKENDKGELILLDKNDLPDFFPGD